MAVFSFHGGCGEWLRADGGGGQEKPSISKVLSQSAIRRRQDSLDRDRAYAPPPIIIGRLQLRCPGRPIGVFQAPTSLGATLLLSCIIVMRRPPCPEPNEMASISIRDSRIRRLPSQHRLACARSSRTMRYANFTSRTPDSPLAVSSPTRQCGTFLRWKLNRRTSRSR